MWQLFKKYYSFLVLLIHNQHSEVENKNPLFQVYNSKTEKLSNLPNVTQPGSNKTKMQPPPLSLCSFLLSLWATSLKACLNFKEHGKTQVFTNRELGKNLI